MFCIYYQWFTLTSPEACHCSNCIWVNQSIITSDKHSRGAGGVSPAYGSRWESVYLLIRFLCVPLSLITQSAISDFPLPEYISVSRSIREHTPAKATALRWALQIIILQRDINFYTGECLGFVFARICLCLMAREIQHPSSASVFRSIIVQRLLLWPEGKLDSFII